MAERTQEAEHSVVSFDTEELILVDDQDREIGYCHKQEAHRGHGTLHRAFSLFIFDREGRLLLQQRSAQKPLWPLYWANSCCSHPRRGETLEVATRRRLLQELGLECDLRFLYKFKYQADFDEHGAEHELCSVFAGTTDQLPQPNANEVAATRFVTPQQLDREIAAEPEQFTPWLKLEWAHIAKNFPQLLQ